MTFFFGLGGKHKIPTNTHEPAGHLVMRAAESSALQIADTSFPSGTDASQKIIDRSPAERLRLMLGTAGVQLADHAVESADDMVKVPFEAYMNNDLDLAAHLSASVAVLAADPGKKSVVLLLCETASSDVIEAVLARLAVRNLALVANGPQAWQCAAPLLMAVASGDLQHGHTKAVRARQQNSGQSALWQSFLAVIQWAYDAGANDIDFVVTVGQQTSQVFFKIDGRYLTLPRWALPTETVVAMLATAWQHSGGGASSKFELRQEQQCRIDVTLRNNHRLRLRWASLATDRGVTVTMRLQTLGAAQVVTTLEKAGFLEEQIEVFRRTTLGKGGLTTLAGTVGSGKTVTLAILMGMLPPHIKAITFEDPVEIEMPWPWLHQRTISRDLVGDDDRDFQSAVRTLFRSSLDVFSLGETRDGPTARVIRAVVESGHSCYTTTHARDAAGIITKFASPQIGIPIDVLGTPGMLRLNVYQALLLKNCDCALSPDVLAQDMGPAERTKHLQLLDDIHTVYGFGPERLKMRNPHGCEKCRKGDLSALWGFAGRTVVAEMMEPDETVCEHVLKSDMVGLKRYWSGLSDGDVHSSDITGKSAMDIAMHKAVQGLIDPHEIELHFSSFRSLASKLDATKRLALRHLSNGRKLEVV